MTQAPDEPEFEGGAKGGLMTKDNLIKAAIGVGVVTAAAVVVTATPIVGLFKVAAADLPETVQDVGAGEVGDQALAETVWTSKLGLSP